MSRSPSPPRFVPTLTEVVHAAPAGLRASEGTAASSRSAADLEEQMVQRVLQRIEGGLERRLRETLGQLVLEHTQALVPRLRDEIEEVVRQSVSQAFEQETPSSTP